MVCWLIVLPVVSFLIRFFSVYFQYLRHVSKGNFPFSQEQMVSEKMVSDSVAVCVCSHRGNLSTPCEQ